MKIVAICAALAGLSGAALLLDPAPGLETALVYLFWAAIAALTVAILRYLIRGR